MYYFTLTDRLDIAKVTSYAKKKKNKKKHQCIIYILYNVRFHLMLSSE